MRTEKKGTWKQNVYGYPVCSLCGYEAVGYGGVKGIETRFCPGCGYSMIITENDSPRLDDFDRSGPEWR